MLARLWWSAWRRSRRGQTPCALGVKTRESARTKAHAWAHSDRSSPFKEEPLPAGSLSIADLGYLVRLDPQRDVERVRYRYLQMTNPEIVERLLQVEQAYAELAEQQAHLQFEMLEIQQHVMEQQPAHRRKREEEHGKPGIS